MCAGLHLRPPWGRRTGRFTGPTLPPRPARALTRVQHDTPELRDASRRLAVVSRRASDSSGPDEATIDRIAAEVSEFAAGFPIPGVPSNRKHQMAGTVWLTLRSSFPASQQRRVEAVRARRRVSAIARGRRTRFVRQAPSSSAVCSEVIGTLALAERSGRVASLSTFRQTVAAVESLATIRHTATCLLCL